MSALNDYSGAISLTAPAGGTTKGTIVNVSTVSKLMAFPYETAASGVTFLGYIGSDKIITAVPKVSGTAWVIGQALAWSTVTTQFTTVTTAATSVVAQAMSAAASADTTGDVRLVAPSALTPA